MPNIATTLREEISRLARREIRAEMESLKNSSSRVRSEIAELKRQIADLSRQIARAAKVSSPRNASVGQDASAFRFSAKGIASHRRRLGLSAEQFGALVGVTGQSIYKWESGKARPRAAQLPAIAGLRALGKREAVKRLGPISSET